MIRNGREKREKPRFSLFRDFWNFLKNRALGTSGTDSFDFLKNTKKRPYLKMYALPFQEFSKSVNVATFSDTVLLHSDFDIFFDGEARIRS